MLLNNDKTLLFYKHFIITYLHIKCVLMLECRRGISLNSLI